MKVDTTSSLCVGLQVPVIQDVGGEERSFSDASFARRGRSSRGETVEFLPQGSSWGPAAWVLIFELLFFFCFVLGSFGGV